jgi:hypothetical protein
LGKTSGQITGDKKQTMKQLFEWAAILLCIGGLSMEAQSNNGVDMPEVVERFVNLVKKTGGTLIEKDIFPLFVSFRSCVLHKTAFKKDCQL